jgi:hypothetical protein
MPRMQRMQAPGDAPDETLSLETRHDRLQALVGELLRTNQELRFKVAQLERTADSVAHAAEESSSVYGLLIP